MSDFKFSCPSCGQHISCDTSNAGMTVACPACNAALVVPQPPQAAPPAHPGLSIAASQARHTAAEATHSAEIMSRTHVQPAAPGPGRPGGQRTSGLAIASLVCSLTGCLGFIPGIICGHLARRNIRRDPSLKGGGLATAGLIISYLSLASSVFVLVFGVSSIMAVFKSPEFKKALADAQKQQELQASHASATSNTPPQESLWNLNLITAQFPDQPAAGKIHGQDFTVESATAQNGNIFLRQGQNFLPDLQVIIFTFLKNGQTLAGKTYDLSPANADLSSGTMPHVHLIWKEEGSATNKTKVFSKGYALKLQLGAADADGNLPAKIYLCCPDDNKSYVAGNFTLEVKKGAEAAAKKKKKKPVTN